MPYYRKKRTWKRKRYSKRSTKYARPKRSMYRKKRKVAIRKYPGTTKQRDYAIPRLRLATTRQKSRFLKLRKDFEWTVAPEWCAQPTNCLYVRVRANSIQDILAIPGSDATGLPNRVWRANDTDYSAIGGNQQFPVGTTLWMGQYYHYTVIASKITVVFNSTDGTDLHDPTNTPGPYQPSLAFINKLGTEVSIPINNNTNKQQLSQLPYTVLGQLPCRPNIQSGTKLTMGYSAKRFEGVPSPLSASQLRGSLIRDPSQTVTAGMHPNEETFYSFGIVPFRGADASTTDFMQPMQCQMKIEYAVVLTEPCPTQLAGVPPGPGAGLGAAAAAAAEAFMDAGGDI